MKSLRKSIFTAVIVAVLVVALFAGTTYAWFSDSIGNTANRISTGTLDVSLYKYSGSGSPDTLGGSANWDEITDDTPADAIFGAEFKNWAPGKSVTVYLAVRNGGSLDLIYSLKLIPINNTLNGALVIGTDSAENVVPSSPTADTPLAADISEISAGTLLPGAVSYVALTVKMLESTGNSYQGGEFNADISLTATQTDATDSAFTYAYSAIDISNVSEGGTVILMNDIEVQGDLSIDRLFNLELNGKTLTVNSFTVTSTASGTMDISDGTIRSQSFNINAPNSTVTQTADIYANGVLINVSSHTYNLMGALIVAGQIEFKGETRLVKKPSATVSAATVVTEASVKLETEEKTSDGGTLSEIAAEDLKTKYVEVSLEGLQQAINAVEDETPVIIGVQSGTYVMEESAVHAFTIAGKKGAEIKRNITITGLGNGINILRNKARANDISRYGVEIDYLKESEITLKNLNVDLKCGDNDRMRGVSLNNSINTTLSVYNCNLSGDKTGRGISVFCNRNAVVNVVDSYTYGKYSLNFAGNYYGDGTSQNAKLNVRNSLIKGWGAINSFSSLEIRAENSEFIGENFYSGATNGFSVFVFDGGGLFGEDQEVKTDAYLNNCSVKAYEYTENSQHVVSFQYKYKTNAKVTAVNCEIKRYKVENDVETERTADGIIIISQDSLDLGTVIELDINGEKIVIPEITA